MLHYIDALVFRCPLQEWPSQSWCCWPAWTRAPTRGSTLLSPAACPESFKTCCSVGHDSADAAPSRTTLRPHTLPPLRTTCTDKHLEDGHTDTRLKIHGGWAAWTPGCEDQCLCRCRRHRQHHRLRTVRPLPDVCFDKGQLYPQQDINLFSPACSASTVPTGRMPLTMSTTRAAEPRSASAMQNDLESKEIFTSVACGSGLVEQFMWGK